jgi:hypothetical protein
MKIFLEVAFIRNQPPELAGFPSPFDRIKCRVVNEAVDVPVRIAQPVNGSGIPMEELRIYPLARSTILVHASLSHLALHPGFHCAHRFIHSRPRDSLNHLVTCNCQVYAERLWNSEHEPIANLPVADRFAVLLPARILTCRQPFTRRRIFVSQQCDELRPLYRTTEP